MTLRLPLEFINRMQAQLGEDWSDFREALQQPAPTSIRLNPGKPTSTLPTDDPVLWHPQAFYLPERPVFTLDPLFHAGAYYVQEASSMFVGWALEQLVDLKQPLRVLDLCAAPGGKSTLLASALHPDSLLLSNEVIGSRAAILRQNLNKWGQHNTWSSQQDSRQFAPLAGYFDVVLVDAPCSGEGLFRKTPDATEEWSENAVQLCVARQKRILAEAQVLLKPGGLLLYTTCTYNEEENIENAKWLEETFHFRPLPLSPPTAWQIIRRERGHQLYPHKVKGEGLFLAAYQAPDDRRAFHARRSNFPQDYQRLSKTQCQEVGNWLNEADRFELIQDNKGRVYALPEHLRGDFEVLRAVFPVFPGLWIGTFKKSLFLPEHPLALSQALQPTVARLELGEEAALQYLRKEEFPLPATMPNGWAVVSHQSLALGWVKVLKNRVNNYLPKDWRIRMRAR